MKLSNVFKHPLLSFKRFCSRTYFNFFTSKIVSDKTAVCGQYKIHTKRKLNLTTPTTFNEKLNWMKLYYRKPEFIRMVDKYEVKGLISSLIGEQYIIPSLGVFNKWDDIDFSKFDVPFVIKTTHSSGCVSIVRDKSKETLSQIKKKINKSLKINYFYHSREWPYKGCKPRIIIEKYVKDSSEENLPVYKFFCFSGEPYIVQTIKNDKTKNETIDYFDMDWQLLDLRQNFNNSEVPLPKPSNFEDMKKLAATLSQDLPFIRVDLYSVNGRIYFSEFTFYSDCGYQLFYPDKWDLILGEKIVLDLNEKNS